MSQQRRKRFEQRLHGEMKEQCGKCRQGRLLPEMQGKLIYLRMRLANLSQRLWDLEQTLQLQERRKKEMTHLALSLLVVVIYQALILGGILKPFW